MADGNGLEWTEFTLMCLVYVSRLALGWRGSPLLNAVLETGWKIVTVGKDLWWTINTKAIKWI